MNTGLSAGQSLLVAVLDLADSDSRPLRAFVEDIDLNVVCFTTNDSLLSHEGTFSIVLAAFEQLLPGPQERLKSLRARYPGARIVVVLSLGTTRARFAKRLWENGAFDYLIDREQDEDGFEPILRQALADSLSWQRPDQPATTTTSARIRALTDFSTALANHDRVEDILKVLHHRMSYLVPFRALALLRAKDRPAMYLFQRGKVTHNEISELYSELCEAANDLTSGPAISMSKIRVVDGAAQLPADGTIRVDDPKSVVLPLMGGGELVGCLGLLSDSRSLDDETVEALHLTANHLASALRFAMTLEKMRRENTTDPLTGLHNRRHLEQMLQDEFQRTTRYKLQLCCMMIDIDHFKRVNDLYGHRTGDAVICNIGALLRSVVRLNDVVFRYGGEEFLIVLPETDLLGATILFERIRLNLATSSILPDSSLEHLRITVSGGISCYDGKDSAIRSPFEVLEIADMALLKAKRSGRDQVLIGAKGQEPVTLATDSEENRRNHHRINQTVPGEFVPLENAFGGESIAVITRDISAGGAAVVDPNNKLQRNSCGLFFLGDSRSPFFSRVNWARSSKGQTLAGLEFLNPRRALAGPEETYKCLVVIGDEAAKKDVSRVVLASGMKVDSMSSAAEVEALHVGDYRIIVIDEDALGSDMGRALLSLREDNDGALELVVLSDAGEQTKSISLLQETNADHLMGLDSWKSRSLFAALNKITAGRRFGVRHYLLPAASVNRWQVTSTSDKRMALQGVRAMAEEVEGNHQIIEHAVAALDEMILNAMRISTDDTGSRPVMVEAGYDTEMLAIGVLDEFGDLNRQAVFSSLSTAMERQKSGLPQEASSASLGFRIMLDSLNHVIVNVEPGKCTEIVGLVSLHNSLREFRESKIGLSLFD